MPFEAATKRLRELISREEKVLTVMHVPSVAMGQVMEEAGAEVGFVGTAGVVGGYTGLGDVGVASIPECVQVGGWIARGVNFPVILDGDTGHGGIMAVRRLVEDSIRAGLAGIRIDDQEIESKRGSGTKAICVAPLPLVLRRYRAAVDCKNELDPNFVIMAQCYAGEDESIGFSETLDRMAAYKDLGCVDWIQFTAPKTVQEVSSARSIVTGPFSVMEGYVGPFLSGDKDLLNLGINIRWRPRDPAMVMSAALYDYLTEYFRIGPAATGNFMREHYGNPYVSGLLPGVPRSVGLLEELEIRYRSLGEIR